MPLPRARIQRLLAALGCVALFGCAAPDRWSVEAGALDGGLVGPDGGDWSRDGLSFAVGVSGPIGVPRPARVEVPVEALLGGLERREPQQPYIVQGDDSDLIFNAILLLVGAAGGIGGELGRRRLAKKG